MVRHKDRAIVHFERRSDNRHPGMPAGRFCAIPACPPGDFAPSRHARRAILRRPLRLLTCST